MKIYTADFGVYGSVTVVAKDVMEALALMRGEGGHPDAQYINVEKIHETITEHEITNGFVFSNLGDI